MKEAISAFFQ